MSLQNLDNLVQRGLLRKEPAHKDELARLLSAADAALADSKVHAVSAASRFAMAYQAALGNARAALLVNLGKRYPATVERLATV